jgi:hypothetical protein
MDGNDPHETVGDNGARADAEAPPLGSRDGVRHDFVHSDMSLDRIGAKHGIHKTTVARWAKREGWVWLVGTRPLATGRKPRPPGTPPPKRPSVAERRRRHMVERLLKIFDAKIRALEARLQQDESDGETPQSAADTERDARSLSNMLAFHAKLVELEQAAQQGNTEATTRSQDADRFRRKLALRLERLARTSDP